MPEDGKGQIGLRDDDGKVARLPSRGGPDRINGVFDLPRSNRVTGWAIDRADAGANVEVLFHYRGKLVAQTDAVTYRPDLEKAGIGTGRYGFACDLPMDIPRGLEFALSATARTGDGTVGPLRRLPGVALSDDPDRRLAQETFLDLDGHAKLDTASLTRAIERVETVQARLEAAADRTTPPAAPDLPHSLKAAVALALVLGVVALALGVHSLGFP